MIPLPEYSGKKVGVFGLGKAGEATVASLQAGGAEVFTWDDKGAGTLDFRQWPWAELAALVLSPGVPLTHPKPHDVVTMAQQHNVPVIGDIELLYRACPEAMYVAITGTNGKSTTTTLIGHILKEAGRNVQVGGNLGTAALSLAPLGKDGIYVLELSSYQLDLVKTTRFNVAVLLNVTPDHLDRHGSMEGYLAAKMHIFERQQQRDTAVVAVDDEWTKNVAHMLEQQKQHVIRVSAHMKLQAGVYVENGVLRECVTYLQDDVLKRACEAPVDINNIATLTGRHNWQNAAAAYAVALTCGVEDHIIRQAMQSFPGLRHRLQLAATIHGVRFINDSKATNADATSNALAPYEHIYWIAGGKQKAGGIVPLAEYFPKVAHAFLIGEAEGEFAKTLEGKVAYTRCGTLENAVKQAAAMAFSKAPSLTLPPSGRGDKEAPSPACGGGSGRGPVVLLSPACASFDQFKSFEHRGDVFCQLVEGISHAS